MQTRVYMSHLWNLVKVKAACPGRSKKLCLKMRATLQALVGLACLAAACLLLAAQIPWVKTWFYDLAWYSWLVVLDALVLARTGRSLIFDRTREFFILLGWSIFIWLIFEHFNLRLGNWHYVDLPPTTWVRWLGYAVAYATVLPALFLTERALAAWGVWRRIKVKPIRPGGRWYNLFFILGLAMFFLPLTWPRYFFPLIWGTFIFLLEPANHRLGGRSLMAEWERGELTTFCRLLLAGLICGGIWEFLNFWAGAKWIYTVPFVGFLKIFEMPILGFLGFPPFAVACYVMYSFIDRLRGGAFFEDAQPEAQRWGRPWRLVVVIIWVVYFNLVFRAIDRYTVINFLG